jgi:cell division protein ZapA
MKQVEVSISGQPYTLACPDGGEQLLAAAVASVDREMNTIRESGKVKARERVAVLAALNVAYQLAERKAAGNSKAAPAPGIAPGIAAGTDASTAAGIDELVRRIDGALADDGQLL